MTVKYVEVMNVNVGDVKYVGKVYLSDVRVYHCKDGKEKEVVNSGLATYLKENGSWSDDLMISSDDERVHKSTVADMIIYICNHFTL